MSLLAANNLTCIKRDRILFEDLSLQFNCGEVVYIKGPNGAGKTSLLRILAGLSAPSEGSLFYNDSPLNKNWEAYTSVLTYVGHKLGLNFTLDALDNSRFWTVQQGLKISDDTIYDVLFTLGLAGLEDVPVGLLSAGQQRRVALARLWFKQSCSILILDEPFTALDSGGITLLSCKIESVVKAGGCAILTSHQYPEYFKRMREVELEYRF